MVLLEYRRMHIAHSVWVTASVNKDDEMKTTEWQCIHHTSVLTRTVGLHLSVIAIVDTFGTAVKWDGGGTQL